ncbi:MAG: hypothetical protein GX235_06555 [Clostridiales bacterium]|nr:hypothetical protein [Clostridiales bacterium]
MSITFLAVYGVILLVVAIITLAGMWKTFEKAGKPGWAAIVPFYNLYCLCDIALGNGWLFLLTFIPCVQVVFFIIVYFKLAKAFGKDIAFGFGLLFLCPIFLCILGFGKAEYIGPNGAKTE